MQHELQATRTGRIAVLAGSLDTEYPRTVISGAADRLAEAGYSALVFAGGMLTDEPGADRFPPLYELLSPERCDGILCLSGIVGQKVDRGELDHFLSRFSPIPAVSIAVSLDSHTSIAIDDAAGMRAAVTHLVEHHRRRCLGFIRGPASSAEAERRYLAYQEVLAAHGLPIDPALIVPGDFTAASGELGAQALMRVAKDRLDAIVGANDVMAAAAARVLEKHGIGVPQRVAIVGFDDAEEARFASPRLTTVRQPLHRLGWHAAGALLSQLNPTVRPTPLVIAPKVVTRESCGCLVEGVPVSPAGLWMPPQDPELDRARPSSDAWLVAASAPAGPVPDPLVPDAPLLLAMREVLETAGVRPESSAEQLIQAFVSDMHEAGRGALRATLRSLLSRLPPFESSAWELRAIPTLLRRWVVPKLRAHRKLCLRAYDLLHDASTLIAASARQTEAHRRLLAESRARSLGQVARAISGPVDLRQLGAALAPALRMLHAQSSNVVVFEEPTRPLAGARLVLRTDPSGNVSLPDGGLPFATRSLLPQGFAMEHSRGFVVVSPVDDAERTIGYSCFELGRDELSIAAELARHVHGAFVRVRREREVARLHACEQERTSELQKATQQLEVNRKRLLVSEKMAALGRLTAGMATEIAAPLGAVREAFEQFERLAEAYDRHLEAAQTGTAEHEPIASAMKGCVERARIGAERVAGFVHGIKVQTRDLSRKEFARFDAVRVIKDTLLLLDHAARRANCRVSFESTHPHTEVHGSPARLAQVVTNLVSNSIDACRPGGGGAIRVHLDEEEAAVVLEVADDGVGIPEEDVSRVFEPLFTTKPFGQGTGLGLNLVHGIVVGEFEGSVAVRSRLGEGTYFVVRLPKRAAHSDPSGLAPHQAPRS